MSDRHYHKDGSSCVDGNCGRAHVAGLGALSDLRTGKPTWEELDRMCAELRERAETAERERDEARAELERLRAFVPRWEPAGSLGAMCLRLGTVALASIARDWSGLWFYRAEVERRDFSTADACARAVCARFGIPYVPVQEQP